MLKIENTEVMGWEHAIRGMRNPMNSWEKSDSGFGCDYSDQHFCSVCEDGHTEACPNCFKQYKLGPNDLDLMKRLRNAGTDHRKYMRMIIVYVDLTGPLYWWKEFDTYKVGTVANSCSTMHKIHAKEFTLADFSCEHLMGYDNSNYWEEDSDNSCFVEKRQGNFQTVIVPQSMLEDLLIPMLNTAREKYIETKDKKFWWQMIQLLPSSYNQRRTVMLNYEVLANIYKYRKDHKLDEWRTFCKWIEGLPYSEIITGIDPVEVSEEHAYNIPDRPMKNEECEV